MQHVALFPFGQYWWFYLGFTALVMVLLLVDLGIFHREAHRVTMREAAGWSIVWVSLALAFNVGFYLYMLYRLPLDPRLAGLDVAALARETALEFLAGYVVEYAESGELAAHWLAVKDIYDLVIMDYYLPEMNGIEAAKKIRQQDPDVPILFISGDPQNSAAVERAFKKDRAVAFLEKPFQPNDLFDAVGKLLSGSG